MCKSALRRLRKGSLSSKPALAIIERHNLQKEKRQASYFIPSREPHSVGSVADSSRDFSVINSRAETAKHSATC